MSISSVSNNVSSLSSYSSKISKDMASLSSGKAINQASDNAANLSISQKMQSQINGTDQAVSNSQDGISLIQTADSALSSNQDALQKMREIAVQASSGTLTDNDRSALQDEFTQLKDQISQAAESTNYNTKNLLDGTLNTNISIGANGESTNVSISNMSSTGLNLDSLSIGTAEDATSAIDALDDAIDTVSSQRSDLGATSNSLESNISNLLTSSQNLQDSQSQILDADIAQVSMDLTKNKILEQASISVLAQKNQNAYSVLQLLK